MWGGTRDSRPTAGLQLHYVRGLKPETESGGSLLWLLEGLCQKFIMTGWQLYTGGWVS